MYRVSLQRASDKRGCSRDRRDSLDPTAGYVQHTRRGLDIAQNGHIAVLRSILDHYS